MRGRRVSRAAFGAAFVEEGPKAVWIKPYGTRRHADVIVAAEYRRYFSFRGGQNQSYESGICFWSGNTQIINYPKQHSANCTAKHQATNGWFEPMVRILKNMRTRMVNVDAIEDGVAPSYFLEGVLYALPSCDSTVRKTRSPELSSCCLTSTDSPTTERAPPGPASRATVGSRLILERVLSRHGLHECPSPPATR